MIYVASQRHREPDFPSPPRLFLAAGELARQVVDRLPEVGRALRVRCEGKFGFAVVKPRDAAGDEDPPEGEPDAQRRGSDSSSRKNNGAPRLESAWYTTVLGAEPAACGEDGSGTESQWWSGVADRPAEPEIPAGGDVKLGLRELIRRLRSLDDDIRLRERRGPNIEVFLLLDLRDLNDVRAGLAALEILNEETRGIDVTAILMTGRQPDSDDDGDTAWKLGLAEVVQAADRRPSPSPLHRAYLQDTENSQRQWCQTLEEAAQMAAEFVFHYALGPYRQLIREKEVTRYSSSQPFSLVLGSFACRQLSSNLECVAKEVADRLLDQSSLFPGADRPLSDYENDQMHEKSRKLRHSLDEVFRPSVTNRNLGNMRNAVLSRMRDSLTEVAREDPLRKTRGFVPYLRQLATTYRVKAHVAQRERERAHVARELKKQSDEGQETSPLDVEPYSHHPPIYEWFVTPVSRDRQIWGGGLLFLGLVIAVLFKEWGRLDVFLVVDSSLGRFVSQLLNFGEGLWFIPIGLTIMFIGMIVLDVFRHSGKRHQHKDGTWTGQCNERTIPYPRKGECVKTDVFWVESKVYPQPDTFLPNQPKPQQRPRVDTRVWPSPFRLWSGIVLAVLGAAMVAYALEVSPRFVATRSFYIQLSIVSVLGFIAFLSLWQWPRKAETGKLLDLDASIFAKTNARRKDFRDTNYPLAYFPRTLFAFLSAIFQTKDTNYPLAYFPRTPWALGRPIGLLLLAGITFWAFGALELRLRTTEFPWPAATPAEFNHVVARFGLLFLAVGLTLAIWPAEREKTVGRIKVVPWPPHNWQDIPGPFKVSDEVDACLLETAEWLAKLFERTPPAAPAEVQHWPAEPYEETFLDAVCSDWPQRLAEQCLPFVRRCAGVPQNWADCVLEGLAGGQLRSDVRLENLDEAFTLRAVESWLASYLRENDWSRLITEMNPESTWLGRFFGRHVAPMWTVRDREVLQDTGVALVDTKLQAAASAESVNRRGHWHVVDVPWRSHDHKRGLVVLIRLAQGIPEPVVRNLLF